MDKKRSFLYTQLKMHSKNSYKYHYISVNNSNFKYISIYTYINFYRNLNIYEICISNHIYHIDLRLFKYQLEFTQEILIDVRETELQKKFNDRLHHQIPCFLSFKFLSNLGYLNVITATDYHHIMKIVLFVLNEIFG